MNTFDYKRIFTSEFARHAIDKADARFLAGLAPGGVGHQPWRSVRALTITSNGSGAGAQA